MASLNARELVVVNLEGVGVGGSVPTVPLPEAVGDAVNMLPSSDFSDALNEPVMPFILRTLYIRDGVRRRVLWTAVRECGRESLGGVGGVICVLQVERLEADEAAGKNVRNASSNDTKTQYALDVGIRTDGRVDRELDR